MPVEAIHYWHGKILLKENITMEFSINRRTLETELSLLSNIASKRDSIAAISGILIEADNNILTLTATNLETTLRTELDIDGIASSGQALFRAKQLADLIKSMNGDVVSFSPIPFDDRILVSCGTSVLKVPVLTEEFPHLPHLDVFSEIIGTVQSKTLASMISRVISSVPTSVIKTVLPGATLYFEPGAVRLDGTDGTRCARVRTEGEGATDTPVSLAIPRRALEALLSLTLGSDPAIMSVQQNQNQIFFTFGHRLFAVTRLAGQLPPYDVIFDKLVALPNLAEIDVKRFIQSIKRVSLMTAEAKEGITLAFSGSELKLNAANGILGEIDETMPIAYRGDDMKTRLNAVFLTDFLGACGVETVAAGFTSPDTPSLWTARTDTMQYHYALFPICMNGPEPVPEPEPKPKKRSRKES